MSTLPEYIKKLIPFFRYNRYGCWTIRISPKRSPDIHPLSTEEIKNITDVLNRIAEWDCYSIELADDDPHSKHLHAVFRYRTEPKRRQIKDVRRQFANIWVRPENEYDLKHGIHVRRLKDDHDVAATIGYIFKDYPEDFDLCTVDGPCNWNREFSECKCGPIQLVEHLTIKHCRKFYEYVKENKIQPTRKRKRGKIVDAKNFAEKVQPFTSEHEKFGDALIAMRDEGYHFRFLSRKENFQYVRSQYSDAFLISWARKHGFQKTRKQEVLEELKEMCPPGSKGYHGCITRARDKREKKRSGNEVYYVTTKHMINKDPDEWLKRCKAFKKESPDLFAAPMSK